MELTLQPESRIRADKEGRTASSSRFTLLTTLAVTVALVWVYARTGTSVSLQVDGRVWTTRTHQSTVEAFLREVGLTLRDEDVVLPALAAPLSDEESVSVQRARQILIEADGELTSRLSHSDTVGEVLMEAGFRVGEHDVLTLNGVGAAAGD